MHDACTATGAEVAEYTVAPVYMEGRSKGAHEWVVEFRTPPVSLPKFTQAVDEGLKRVNSDYEAKRFKDTTLTEPQNNRRTGGNLRTLAEGPRQSGGPEQGSAPLQRPDLCRRAHPGRSNGEGRNAPCGTQRPDRSLTATAVLRRSDTKTTRRPCTSPFQEI